MLIADLKMNAQELKDRTTVPWLELIVDDKLLPEKKIAPLLEEANERVAIMAASYISASRSKRDGHSQSAIRNQPSEIGT
jgi:hypothetical protein